MSLSLFESLTENIGDTLRPHFGVIQQIFARGLVDQEQSVRIASLKCVGSLVHCIVDSNELVRNYCSWII